jgi:hypothetical protein
MNRLARFLFSIQLDCLDLILVQLNLNLDASQSFVTRHLDLDVMSKLAKSDVLFLCHSLRSLPK